ncbi:MAG: GntR family transcriptional regulator [Lentisphaeria bacterium]|nr:GntR family transcriptional regulator [Lentisphaeria bacterium]
MVRFEKIANTLEKQIRSGEITGKLPSEKELAAKFSVAGMTMSRAMSVLKKRGLVQQIHRRGTFVVPPEKKVLRLLKSSCVYFAGKNHELWLSKFPDVSFELVQSLDEADIAVFPTIIPMNYSSHFIPWPQEIIRKLRESGDFFDQAFEFHHIGTPVYAVAYSFCPCLMAYNKELMQKYKPDFTPDNFTCSEMAELLKLVAESELPVRQKTNRLLISLAYCAGSLDKVLDDFRQLRLSPEPPEALHEKIFSVITRRDIYFPEMEKSCGVMPMPKLNGVRCSHPVSESVFVPLNSRYPETAFQIAAHTLSEDFQQAVAESNDNIPSNRKIAESCRHNGVLSDELFYQETKNIHYPREIIDPLSTAVILMGLKEFAGNRLALNDFLKLLQTENENMIRRKQAIENILGNIFSF